MGNHFHLLLETPEANLSSGMRVLLGTYSQARNSKQKRRAHGESMAERIIGLVGAALELPRSMDELGALRKGDPRKLICAASVKAHTSMNNDWLAQRLCMGDPTAISQLLNRVRLDAKNRKILKMHGNIFKSKD